MAPQQEEFIFLGTLPFFFKHACLVAGAFTSRFDIRELKSSHAVLYAWVFSQFNKMPFLRGFN